MKYFLKAGKIYLWQLQFLCCVIFAQKKKKKKKLLCIATQKHQALKYIFLHFYNLALYKYSMLHFCIDKLVCFLLYVLIQSTIFFGYI